MWPLCIHCQKASWRLLCANCLRIYQFKNCCPFCGHLDCLGCYQKQRDFGRLYVSFKYQAAIRDWLLSTKIKNRPENWRELRPEYFSSIDFKPFDGLVTVPSDPLSLQRRGFDNSMHFAKAVARLSGLRLESAFCRKPFLRPQKQLSAQERRYYLSQCLSLKASANFLKGGRFLLVDDVMSSGASVELCSELLRKAGAEVDVYVFARRIAGGS